MITDSVGGVFFWATAPRDAFAKGLDLDLEVKTCRKLVSAGCPAYGDDHPASALETIRALGDQIGSVVVIDVGYNDVSDSYAAGLDEVMRALTEAGAFHGDLGDPRGAAKLVDVDQRADTRRTAALARVDGG